MQCQDFVFSVATFKPLDLESSVLNNLMFVLISLVLNFAMFSKQQWAMMTSKKKC